MLRKFVGMGTGVVCYFLTSVATSDWRKVTILRKPVIVSNYFHLHNIALSKQCSWDFYPKLKKN